MAGIELEHSKDASQQETFLQKSGITSVMPERYVMVLLCALCTCINYADRVNMSVAIISMSEAYSLSLRQQSVVMSSFFIGYIPMQLGGALLCRRLGGKTVLAQGALLWSVFTIATPFTADLGMTPLLCCRVLMGLAEGVAFPGVFHFLSSWIPPCERGRSIALFLTGAHVGTMLALIVSPAIIRTIGWRFVFYIFGSVGFFWVIAWQLLAYDRDDTMRRRSSDPSIQRPHQSHQADEAVVPLSQQQDQGALSEDAELDAADAEQTVSVALIANPSAAAATTSAPSAPGGSRWAVFTVGELRLIRNVLTDRRTLSVCMAQGIFALIHYVILSWLPTYFKHVYKTDIGSLSFTFAPYAAMAVSANLGGWVADVLIEKGWPVTRVRKALTSVASVGAAVSLVVFSRMQSVWSSLVAVSFSMAFMSINSGGFEAAYLDVASPQCTGLFKAVSNTVGSFAGLIAVPLSTLVLEWVGGSWRIMFATLAFWHILLAIVFCLFFSADRVLTDDGR